MTDWIEPGMPAPAFELSSGDGQTVRLQDLRGRPVVLYFYPKDETPGCTREACHFRDWLSGADPTAEILGVSPDGVESHRQFAERHQLNFRLLADPDHRVAEAYGAWRLRNLYGKKFYGIQRSTFLLDAQGVVRKVWRRVSVDRHVDQVQEALAELE